MHLIIIKVVITIILSRTNVEMTIFIRQSFANLPTLKNVLKEINVGERITGSSAYITKINTKPSFATVILAKLEDVNTENIAPLLILLRTLKSASFTIWYHNRQILIFTFSISKQNGVPTTMNITKPSVFMLTTFKIFDANPIFSAMRLNSVKIGKVAPSSLAMRRVVNALKNVLIAMGGKNNSFIH